MSRDRERARPERWLVYLACALIAVLPSCKESNGEGYEEAVVLLVPEGGDSYCSGVLIAPDQVLTARHCVSEVGQGVFGCREDGTLAAHVSGAGQFMGDRPPKGLRVFTGPSWPAAGAAPAARGARISHDPAALACGHDIAILHLDRPVAAARYATPSRRQPAPGDVGRVVGWGVDERGVRPSRRQDRAGRVARIGAAPGAPGSVALADAEIEIESGACEGDSGGALFGPDGSLLGIISRGSGDQRIAHGPGCSGPSARAIVTRPLLR